MKYFTPAWHSGDLDDAASNRPFEEYKRHLAGLLRDLPPEVRRLAKSINIHDGLLWEAKADPEQETLRLVLRCGDLQVGYFDLELEYRKAIVSAELTEALKKLPVVPPNQPLVPYSSEALYDEVDREGDFIVHRILFWQNDRRESQAQRRLRRQKRDGRRRRRYRLRLKGNNYRELTIRFKQLRLSTTPRGSRDEAAEEKAIEAVR